MVNFKTFYTKPPITETLKGGRDVLNVGKTIHYTEQCQSVTIDICNEPQEKCVDVPREHCKNLKNTVEVMRDRLVAVLQLHEYDRES